MKKDIENIQDIQLLVNSFYNKVKTDKTIGFFFNNVVNVNWEKHLPVIYNFWENALFYSGSYQGNPMEIHKHLHNISPLTAGHFKQWLYLFNTTVDELFKGKTASLAKQRALSIATVMQAKIISAYPAADKIY
jgi:hemoglobin